MDGLVGLPGPGEEPLSSVGYTPVGLTAQELRLLAFEAVSFTRHSTTELAAAGPLCMSQGALRILIGQMDTTVEDLNRYLQAMVELEGELS